MAVSEFKYESCIRGYHIYKDMWSSTVGEHLMCEREMLNLTDRYAIADRCSFEGRRHHRSSSKGNVTNDRYSQHVLTKRPAKKEMQINFV